MSKILKSWAICIPWCQPIRLQKPVAGSFLPYPPEPLPGIVLGSDFESAACDLSIWNNLQCSMLTPDSIFKTQKQWECRSFWELVFQKSSDRTCHWLFTSFARTGGLFNDECYCLGTIHMLHSPQPTTELVEVSQRVPWSHFFSFLLPSCLW